MSTEYDLSQIVKEAACNYRLSLMSAPSQCHHWDHSKGLFCSTMKLLEILPFFKLFVIVDQG